MGKGFGMFLRVSGTLGEVQALKKRRNKTVTEKDCLCIEGSLQYNIKLSIQ